MRHTSDGSQSEYHALEATTGSSISAVNSSQSETQWRAGENELGRSDGVGLWGSVFALMCTTVGTGILALPSAVQSGGYLALVLVVATAVIANFTAKRLVECLHIVPGRTLRYYADVGLAAMGRHGWRAVVVLQCGTLVGVATIFLILIGHFMTELWPGAGLTLHDWVFVAGLVLLPFSWLKSMKEIQSLAFLGIAASAFVGIFVIVHGLHRFASHHAENTYRVFVGKGMPVAFNIIVFSFGGTSVLPTIEADMKRRADFPRMANIAYALIATIYTLVAAAGYMGWGSLVDSDSGNILNVMDSSASVTVSQVLILMHVASAYPIPLAPVFRYMEQALLFHEMPERKELASRVALRSGMVLLTVFIASIIPYFGNVLSLLSALTVILTVFVMPCAFYWMLSLKYAPQNLTTTIKLKMTAAIVIGVLGTIAGTYYGFKNLIHSINEHPNPFYHYFRN